MLSPRAWPGWEVPVANLSLGDSAPKLQGYQPLCYLWEAAAYTGELASLCPTAVAKATSVGPFPTAADSSIELQPCVEAASKFP